MAQAQYNLGIFYENGYGVDTDLVRAREWYELAASQGLEEATSRLASLGEHNASANVAAQQGPQSVPELVPASQNQPTETTVSGYELAEISPTGIKHEDWVMQQRPDSYTLQIGSVTVEDDIVKFIQRHAIEDQSAYIQVVIDGVTRYSAFYGVYSSYSEAEQAVAGLPASLRQVSPWIRNFGILQKMLN